MINYNKTIQKRFLSLLLTMVNLQACASDSISSDNLTRTVLNRIYRNVCKDASTMTPMAKIQITTISGTMKELEVPITSPCSDIFIQLTAIESDSNPYFQLIQSDGQEVKRSDIISTILPDGAHNLSLTLLRLNPVPSLFSVLNDTKKQIDDYDEWLGLIQHQQPIFNLIKTLKNSDMVKAVRRAAPSEEEMNGVMILLGDNQDEIEVAISFPKTSSQDSWKISWTLLSTGTSIALNNRPNCGYNQTTLVYKSCSSSRGVEFPLGDMTLPEGLRL